MSPDVELEHGWCSCWRNNGRVDFEVSDCLGMIGDHVSVSLSPAEARRIAHLLIAASYSAEDEEGSEP